LRVAYDPDALRLVNVSNGDFLSQGNRWSHWFIARMLQRVP